MMTIMHVELGLAFGKRSTKDQWMFGALPWWALWELRQQTRGWETRLVQTRKSTAREWSEALLWAVVVAGSLRMLIVEPFTIPTPSMEGSMLGDYLIVDKTAYGPKLPQTPVSMPFIHNALPGGLTPSYTSWFTTPYTRLRMAGVKRYDAVQLPGDTVYVDPVLVGHDTQALLRREGIRRAGGTSDLLFGPRQVHGRGPQASGQFWVEGAPHRQNGELREAVRGLARETVSVVEGQLHINGEAVENPEGLQMEHCVRQPIRSAECLRKLGLTKLDLGPVSAIPEGIAAVMALMKRRCKP